MELCDQYLHENIDVDPTLNDFFLKEEYLSSHSTEYLFRRILQKNE